MWKNLIAHSEPIVVALIIFFGAVVHATSHLQVSRKNNTPFTFTDFVVLWVLGVGSGLLSYFASSIFFDGQQMAILLFTLSGAVVGMAGTMKIANAALEFLALKFGKPLETPNNNNDEK